MADTGFPPDVAGLLGRLRDRLAARDDVVGVYVYGSLVTGDYSPAASDIRRRRDGQPVTLSRSRRFFRAVLARRIMQDGVARLSRLDPPASRTHP